MRYLTILLVFFYACGNPIKDETTTIDIEPGTETATPSATTDAAAGAENVPKGDLTDNDLLGFWVGDFLPAGGATIEQTITPEAEFEWDRTNKINIVIDAIRGDSVFGHSVVAGNDRPFSGVRQLIDGTYQYQVREPGDDRYDGEFKFSVKDGSLIGSWSAYKKIDIRERVFALEMTSFKYDPQLMLDEASWYLDWTNTRTTKKTDVVDGEEVYSWMAEEYASATEKIYELNASAQRLTKAQVENLKKGDLTIIRNTIYARHGYSFKQRPLRVFFDAQPWYIPVHADIRADFTELEKENIQLLLKYEKNAAEYYDYFGRG